MANDVTYHVSQITSSIILMSAHALAQIDILKDEKAALEAQVKDLTAKLDEATKTPVG